MPACWADWWVDVGTTGDNDINSHNPGVCVWTGWSDPTYLDGNTVRHSADPPTTMLLNIQSYNYDWNITVKYKITNGIHGEFQQFDGTAYRSLGLLYGDGTWHHTQFVARSVWLYDQYVEYSNINAKFRFCGDFGTSLYVDEIFAVEYTPSPTGYACDVGTPVDDRMYYHNPGIHIEAPVTWRVEWSDRTKIDLRSCRIGITDTPNLYSNIQSTGPCYQIKMTYKIVNDGNNVQQYLGPLLDQWDGSSYTIRGRLYTTSSAWYKQCFMLQKPYYDYEPGQANTNVYLRFSGGLPAGLHDRLYVDEILLETKSWPKDVGYAFTMPEYEPPTKAMSIRDYILGQLTGMGWVYHEDYDHTNQMNDKNKDEILNHIPGVSVFIFVGHGDVYGGQSYLKVNDGRIYRSDLDSLEFREMKFAQLCACRSHDNDYWKSWVRNWQGNGAVGNGESCLSISGTTTLDRVQNHAQYFYPKIGEGWTIQKANDYAKNQPDTSQFILEGNPEVTLKWPAWAYP